MVMDALSLIGYIAGVFGLVSVVTASIIIVKSTTSKTTIEQQKELIAVLSQGKAEQNEKIVELQGQHADAMKAISNLQGQVDVLKNIPLVNIDGTLKELAKFNKSIASSNELILKHLGAGV